MKCRKFRKLIAESLYEELPEKCRKKFKDHISACPACREQAAELERTVLFLKPLPGPEFSRQEMDALRSRVREEISRAAIERRPSPKRYFPRLGFPTPALRLAAAALVILVIGAAILLRPVLRQEDLNSEKSSLVIMSETIEEEIESMVEISQEIDYLRSLSREGTPPGPEAGAPGSGTIPVAIV